MGRRGKAHGSRPDSGRAQGEAERNYAGLSEEEKGQIEAARNRLLLAYHADDHLLIRAQIQALDRATMGLAEKMMDSAVSAALKGTKI